MLLVEPEAVEPAVLAEDLDDLRVEDLADAEQANRLPLRQSFLDPRHACVPSSS